MTPPAARGSRDTHTGMELMTQTPFITNSESLSQ